MAASGQLPVSVLTGYLGSGKTTLLQRLLRAESFGDTAVLVNEFGEIGLDQHLIGEVAPEVLLLDNGCICCALRGELSEALRTLHGRRQRGEVPPFRRLVLETTGLAEPGPILATLLHDPVVRHHFRPGRVVTTVDALNGAAQLARADESLQQAAAADRLVITKTDLAAPGAAAALRERLAAINPAALIGTADEPALAPARLFSPRRDDAAARQREARRWLRQTAAPHRSPTPRHPVHGHEPDTHADFHTHTDTDTDTDIPAHADRLACSFVLELDRRLDWTAFGLWLSSLLNRHGGEILRVKGLLDVGSDTGPVVLNGVQHLVYPPQHLARWPEGQPRGSRLVFILRAGTALDGSAIRASLTTFLRTLALD